MGNKSNLLREKRKGRVSKLRKGILKRKEMKKEMREGVGREEK